MDSPIKNFYWILNRKKKKFKIIKNQKIKRKKISKKI